MTKYTGGEIISKYLIKEGVKYVIGIAGHGNLPLVDAFFRDKDKIKLIQPKQEMSGVHLAVGYYRVTGQPLCVFTSIDRVLLILLLVLLMLSSIPFLAL